jgi:hypothetical protein
MLLIYHWIIAVPHEDKRRMERVMVSGVGKG